MATALFCWEVPLHSWKRKLTQEPIVQQVRQSDRRIYVRIRRRSDNTEHLSLHHNTTHQKEIKSCQQIPSGFTACFVRRPRESIGRSSMPTQWSNGFLRTDSPARSTIWMPGSAAPTGCRLRISPRDIATPSAERISN